MYIKSRTNVSIIYVLVSVVRITKQIVIVLNNLNIDNTLLWREITFETSLLTCFDFCIWLLFSYRLRCRTGDDFPNV